MRFRPDCVLNGLGTGKGTHISLGFAVIEVVPAAEPGCLIGAASMPPPSAHRSMRIAVTEPIPLFRSAALRAKRGASAGNIVLIQPVSFTVLVAAAVALAGAIVAYLSLGSFTDRETLLGRLVTEPASVTVSAPQYGTIVERHAADGEFVARGAALFVLSSERVSDAVGATQASIARGLRQRYGTLAAQLAQLRDREASDRAALSAQSLALSAEAEIIDRMLDNRLRRVELAAQAAQGYREMSDAGFATEEQLIARQENLLEQQAQVQSLRRERSRIESQLADVGNRLLTLSSGYQQESAELQLAMIGTRHDIAENEARRRITIVSPVAGMATAITAEVGQAVQASQLLMTLIPAGARLRAELYAPSRAIGLVDVGDRAVIRYAAYPYQRFGHHGATVVMISATTLPEARRGGAEPVYRVIAELDGQSLTAHGKARPLRAGMSLEADVLGERRRLYRWMLDRLSVLGGT